MRVYLPILLFAILPLASAVGQPVGDPNNAIGNRPPQGRPGAPGPQGFLGPPPNVMFNAIDVDGDGTITKAELRRAVVQLRKLDTDGDGNITLAEVSPPGGPGGPAGNPAQFVAQMMANDLNGDGQLSPNEVPDHLKPMLQNADLDNSGTISRQELTALAVNMRNQFPGGPGAGPWNDAAGGLRGQGGVGNRAADPQRMTGQMMRNDRNNDGKLSADELPDNMRGMFKPADDLDGDGALDAAELRAAVERMGDQARGVRDRFNPDRGDPRDRRGGRNRTRDGDADEE